MHHARSVILPTAYCPPISYLAQFFRYPNIVLEQQENYQKGSYRNRCHIATANGLLRLSVPLLQGKHQRMPIKEVRIDYREPWVKNHLDSLVSAYRSAPFFPEYFSMLEPVFRRKPDFLFDLNLELLTCFLQWLNWNGVLEYSKEYQSDAEASCIELRNAFSPKAGREECGRIDFDSLPYPQVFADRHGFLPNLSILDLLFCLGPESIFTLKKGIE